MKKGHKYIIIKIDGVNDKNKELLGISDLRDEYFPEPEIIAEFDDAKEWKAEFNKLVLSGTFHNCALSRHKFVDDLGKYCEAYIEVFDK